MDDSADLQQMLLDDRVAGLNYIEIAAKHGIPAAEVRELVREALEETASKDPIELRMITQVRIEKVVNHLWAGLEQGSFKHGEAILKATERLAELMDLNQQSIKHEITIISDEETRKLLDVIKYNNNHLLTRVRELPLNDESKAALEQWPAWAAEASTEAVDEVLYMEEENGVYR